MGGKRNEEGMAGKKRVDRVRSDSLQGFCAFVESWWVIRVVGRAQRQIHKIGRDTRGTSQKTSI